MLRNHLAGVAVVVVVCVFFLSSVAEAKCPCLNASYCDPIEYSGKEVYGLVQNSPPSEWTTFKFDKLTTLIMLDFFNVDLVCLAHSHGVRVMQRAMFDLHLVSNHSRAEQWIKDKVQFATINHLDGIELYIDEVVAKDSALVGELNDFVRRVVVAFRTQAPTSVVIFSVPWSPYNEKNLPVDGRAYDYLKLSTLVDQLFVMNYDQRSQSFEWPCLAGSDSGYFDALGGLLAYKNLTVDTSKLVLGFAGYGRDFTCTNNVESPLHCTIEPQEYRGAKCSSKVGKVLPQKVIFWLVRQKKAAGFWDEHSATTMWQYKENNTVHQIFHDDHGSLARKVTLANENNVKGVGMFMINFMDSTLWDALPNYRHH